MTERSTFDRLLREVAVIHRIIDHTQYPDIHDIQAESQRLFNTVRQAGEGPMDRALFAAAESIAINLYFTFESTVKFFERTALADWFTNGPYMPFDLIPIQEEFYDALMREESPLITRPAGYHPALAATISSILESTQNAMDLDLRDANLTGIPLEGIRWSDGTRWPDELAGEVRAKSREIASGVYVVIGRGRSQIHST